MEYSYIDLTFSVLIKLLALNVNAPHVTYILVRYRICIATCKGTHFESEKSLPSAEIDNRN